MLLESGAVSCWGRAGSGQIGDELPNSGPERYEVPHTVDLGAGVSATQISVAGDGSCALLDNDTIKCWGDNNDGQLGPGYFDTHEHSPVEVATGSQYGFPTSVSISPGHGCAVMSSRNVLCWGVNSSGQIGRNTSGSNQQLTPSAVYLEGNTLAEAVTTEPAGTCILRTDGQVECWAGGYGGTGPQLVDPIDFGDGLDVQTLVSGGVPDSTTGQTCALLLDSTIACFDPANLDTELLAYSPPGEPLTVEATPALGAADITWQASPRRGGAPTTSYTATASPGDASCTTSSTGCTITGLDSTTAYTVTVTATNSYGTSDPSEPSSSISPNGVPSAPTNVAVTTSNSQATISWDPPTFNGGSAISAYTVTTDPGAYTCTTAATSCTITDMAGGADFDFSVTATNDSGEGTASTAVTANVPSQFAVVASVDVGNWPAGIHFDGEHIWVTNNDESTINKIDINPAQIEATVTAPGTQVAGVTSDVDGNIWVAGPTS